MDSLKNALKSQGGSMTAIHDPIYSCLKTFSTRHLYSKLPDYKVLSMDAKSIDLRVLCSLAGITSWNEIFNLGLDNHFEILRIGNPAFFAKIFKKFGGLSIAGIKELSAPPDSADYLLVTLDKTFELDAITYKELKLARDVAKQTNLGIPYMLGAKSLAEKIFEATGEPMTIKAADEMLVNYYTNFPEIRRHHDQFALRIFKQGYHHPQLGEDKFGMPLHSNTWYTLNTHRVKSDKDYRFIIKFRGHHFHISLNSWLQNESLLDGEVSIDLKPALPPLSLFFQEVVSIKQLSDSIFALKLKTKKSKRRRNEDLAEEESDFEIGSIDRTHLIKQQFLDSKGENELNELETDLFHEISHGSIIKVRQSLIKYYYDTTSNHQNYFKQFKDLITDTKKLFPSYIQGVSAVCVGRVLSNIRLQLEKRKMKSFVFLSVHDSIDIMAHVLELKEMAEIIKCKDILLTFIPVTWSYNDEPYDHWN